jgi:hypothetical protein
MDPMGESSYELQKLVWVGTRVEFPGGSSEKKKKRRLKTDN